MCGCETAGGRSTPTWTPVPNNSYANVVEAHCYVAYIKLGKLLNNRMQHRDNKSESFGRNSYADYYVVAAFPAQPRCDTSVAGWFGTIFPVE